MTPDGLEPSTLRLEVTCSIQLSYGAKREHTVASDGYTAPWIRPLAQGPRTVTAKDSCQCMADPAH